RGVSTFGEAAILSRPIARWVEAGTNYLRSQSGNGPRSRVISGVLRQTLSSRISVLQLISNSNGQTSVAFGGNYFSNHFTIGIDYQTVYVPFLAQPFKQAMGVTLQLRPFRGIELNGQSFISPDGRTRYTASGSTLFTERSCL